MSWNAGLRGFRQVDESRRVGRARGELPLYYMLGSDPALWPAGGRREGELITHDKGYYHLRKFPSLQCDLFRLKLKILKAGP